MFSAFWILFSMCQFPTCVLCTLGDSIAPNSQPSPLKALWPPRVVTITQNKSLVELFLSVSVMMCRTGALVTFSCSLMPSIFSLLNDWPSWLKVLYYCSETQKTLLHGLSHTHPNTTITFPVCLENLMIWGQSHFMVSQYPKTVRDMVKDVEYELLWHLMTSLNIKIIS